MLIRNLTAICLLVLASSPASAAVGPWSEADNVRVRLVATAPDKNGYLEGAIEIELSPGWKTYWRSPGDAGVPPRFDFSASANVREASVDFPAPKRDDDGYAASNVYRDRVLLPMNLTLDDPHQPVVLEVRLDIGICEQICIPVNLNARLDLPRTGADSATLALIAAAQAALPGPGRPGEFELLSLKRIGGSDQKPEFEAVIASAHPSDAELFVETPDDWYADAPKPVTGPGGLPGFRFSVDRRSAEGEIGGAEVRLTLTEGDAATSRTFKLDAGSARP